MGDNRMTEIDKRVEKANELIKKATSVRKNKLPKVLFRSCDDMEHIVIFDNGFVKSDECEGYPTLSGLDVLRCLAKHGYIELEEEMISDEEDN